MSGAISNSAISRSSAFWTEYGVGHRPVCDARSGQCELPAAVSFGSRAGKLANDPVRRTPASVASPPPVVDWVTYDAAPIVSDDSGDWVVDRPGSRSWTKELGAGELGAGREIHRDGRD